MKNYALKRKILTDKEALKKLRRAMSGEEGLTIEIDDKTYNLNRVRITDRPADGEG